jgi:cytochrome c oxidase cbb3-type subunit II
MNENHNQIMHKIDKSAVLTVIGILLLFATSIITILFAPSYIDPSWTTPSSSYQVQMYEVADPNLYISSASSGSSTLQFVYHLQNDFTLLTFHESNTVRIIAPPELEKYITRFEDPALKLTSHLMLLRKPEPPQAGASFNPIAAAERMRSELQKQWEKEHPNWEKENLYKPHFDILELYDPGEKEAFAVAPSDLLVENWVDDRFVILDEKVQQSYHQEPGVIYIKNPIEYRVSHYVFGNEQGWRYDPNGEKVKNLEQLKSHPLGFRSREELIKLGEHIFAIEGCWYCHTDQTRTLVQDVVLNGSDSFPAPPSAANEYIYQKITFPGTRRIGPDLSRVAIKRSSRDWHKGHFWSPKTASKGSIMPAFKHFFDNDPRGTSPTGVGIPNYRFEAVFQYLMTKGSRITSPNQAWWLGKDPVQTMEIIEGRRRIP